MSQLDKQDPRDQFPRPPFPAQTQQGSGLASAMDPAPDHGETSYLGTGRMRGYRVLVTGADSGIGRAAAIAMAKEGADVALNALPEEREDLEQVRDVIGDLGRKAVLLPGDLTDEAFCDVLVQDAVSELGGLDALVLVAGHQQVHEDITVQSTEDFDRTMKVNLYSLFWLVRAAVPHMAPGSSIVTTSSVSAYQPQDRMIDYAATKAAIITYTNGLARQLASKGIRANTVVPGPVWTPLQPISYPGDEIAAYGQDTPFGRPAQPVELGSAYVYLAGPESSYTSGTTLTVAGATGVAL
ncbi:MULTISPECIES: SDR family oxidoreductase [Curtobacterium]|jgi:NAD(P)-dependent dehydrogenase (short-subunit alcohol dehydrogenase family)|uniref:SDR family oxidoreductase n=1 Tax=Curtobacterium TaxID=2034 RepID=UPI0008DC7D23|nr:MULTISPECIES: SDR family oxidoreductase [Curtobacterium]MBT1630807.1 SDR family oxidoreductase [Curtobacterium flaccumfaciens pv. oortii]MBT1669671.1 SDR family oxidoreductase [Curtobacterium flaccumfaciens pv. flaccumfaciens]MCS5504916.1 SDR family oxidoreductase [Curtobacterium flaccumfaciens pv. flaccumfaciens]MCX2844215.1 SDR family oxidoreductase [Curtobacterium flaccumfaciens pv. oortii]MDO3699535.1 SDR family oxidoreductase [Curtobacterium flaccumfaciens]